MDMKHKAKSEMLKTLSKMMADDQNAPVKEHMGKKLSKVTVMSDSKEGLKKGLSTAEQLMAKKNGPTKGETENPSEVDPEAVDEESMAPGYSEEYEPECADEDMSDEEIQAMMDALRARMEAKKAKA